MKWRAPSEDEAPSDEVRAATGDRVWHREVLWRRNDIVCPCGYVCSVTWSVTCGGPPRAVCTKCGNCWDVDPENPPRSLPATVEVWGLPKPGTKAVAP